MPVFPLVASTMTIPFFSRPSLSLSSRMYLTILSLMLPVGLTHSSLAKIPPTSTRGVFPTSSCCRLIEDSS